MSGTPCADDKCPGEQGLSSGYGLAGGGIGAYTYCERCFRIIEKWQDPIDEEEPT